MPIFKSNRANPRRLGCDWFSITPNNTTAQVGKLSGPWSEDIDASAADIHLGHGWKKKPLGSNSWNDLLATDSDWIVSSLNLNDAGSSDSSDDSRLILIRNGSFLLNLPLVNHEHRKLAGRLINEFGSKRRVVFLISDEGGPTIFDEEPKAKSPSGLEGFFEWPENVVWLHLAAAGIVICLARWPIFGRPRRPERTETGDFGLHITALGDMMSQTKDARFAQEKLMQYYQTARPESR